MMGQSNMLGEGTIGDATHATNGTLEFAVKSEKKYPYLIDSDGNWAVSKSVRNVFVMGSGGPSSKTKLEHNEFMTVKGKTIGPELGIGHSLEASGDPVMTDLRSATQYTSYQR